MSPTAITLTDRLQLLNFYAKKIREREKGKKRRREAKGRERKSRGEGERKGQKGGGEKRPYSCLVLWMPLDRTDISKCHRREQRAARGRGSDRTFT